MNSDASGRITQLLSAASDGDERAVQQLWSIVYEELHRLARQQMAREGPGRTMQPTALVHEAYLRLFGGAPVDWANRRHFFAAAARVMRQIRIDDARKRNRLKRRGGPRAVASESRDGLFDENLTELLAVHEALERLERADPRKAEVVMLRYFAGLTEEETAAAMELSRRTVQLEWRVARAWLHREMS